jgi:predicted DNA binding CopG/RHH family protein
MKIIGLDIETASTKTNSLIFEIGMISVEVPSYSKIDIDWIWDIVTKKRPQTSKIKTLVLPVPFVEQCSLGRDQTVDTYNFHTQSTTMKFNFQKMMEASVKTRLSVKDVLARVKAFCLGADEIWINGLSFDPCILKSLAESVGDNSPLWKFRAETDVRSFYRIFALDADVSLYSAHRAINDCVRNLTLVRELGVQMEAQTLKFRIKSPYRQVGT